MNQTVVRIPKQPLTQTEKVFFMTSNTKCWSKTIHGDRLPATKVKNKQV